MRNALWWVLLVATLGGLIAGIYYWQHKRVNPIPQPPLTASQPAPQTSPAPQIRHPIEALQSKAEKPSAAQQPLPPLKESDAALHSALAALFSERSLEKFFYLKDIIYRVVATIDNLPRQKLAQRLLPVKPPLGRFSTVGEEGSISIDPGNYRRYTPYAQLAEAVDAKKLVAVYVHFYPLFQQAYEELGYPDRYFNDRLIEVIDNLLATPDVQGPIKLIRPHILYQFANPELERLSAGQKILVRMGSSNAAKIKAKLREIRELLTGGIPKS